MSYDKAVKGATKVKDAAPKPKYISVILAGTSSGEAALGEICRSLASRLGASTWTVPYKALIVYHIMMREGERDATLEYLSRNRKLLEPRLIHVESSHADEIMKYAKYLREKVVQYARLHRDFIHYKEKGRLRKLTVEKGLLREVEGVLAMVGRLLNCRYYTSDVEDDISLTAFRLLVSDLLVLFQALNEGVINVLEHYFEMSRYDAERALNIYLDFVDKTDGVIEYLQVARRLESQTRLQVPHIKHAPTSLGDALAEYLEDPNFDSNRRQYLAEQELEQSNTKTKSSSKSKTGKDNDNNKSQPDNNNNNPGNKTGSSSVAAAAKIQNHPDLVNFFTSFPVPNQQQQAMPQPTMVPLQHGPVQAQYQQPPQPQQQIQMQPQMPMQTGFNPFGTPSPHNPALQTAYTEVGFGGFGPQPSQSSTPSIYQQQPQQQQPQQPMYLQTAQQSQVQAQSPPFATNTQQLPPTQTGSGPNPFLQSTTTGMTTGSGNPFGGIQRASTLPATMGYQPANGVGNLAPQQTGSNLNQLTYSVQQHQQQQQPVVPQVTGSNPFAKMQSQPTGVMNNGIGNNSSPLLAQPTGSNPFRKSLLPLQATGQPPQRAMTFGGLENLPTVPVFSQPQQQQQQPQQYLQQQQPQPTGMGFGNLI